MKCRHCGKENPEGYKFCGYCGKEQRSCPKCGQDVPNDMLYCGHCGVKMEQSSNPEVRPAVQSPYKGKTCPYCQAPFKDGTDVVLCKDCNMPHHQGCWAENGNKCTTFGCAGATVGKVEQSTDTESPSLLAREPVTLDVTEVSADPSGGPRAGGNKKRGELFWTDLIASIIIGAIVGGFFGGAVFGGAGIIFGALLGAVIIALLTALLDESKGRT